jgi:hypothetical protein
VKYLRKYSLQILTLVVLFVHRKWASTSFPFLQLKDACCSR